jgi:hypothetical protein
MKVPGLERYKNLLRFNINFSKYADNDLQRQSPDYILEKYNWWVGFEPTTQYPHYTPDSCQVFLNGYHKIWGNSSEKIRRQLLYLYQSEDLNLRRMVPLFEKYIGPIELLSDEPKSGLHIKTETEFLNFAWQLNEKYVKTLTRDLLIGQVVK